MRYGYVMRLTPQQIEQAVEHILELRPLETLHRKLGFQSRREFTKYLKTDTAFAAELDNARLESCRYLEDEMLYVNDNHDHKAARVKLEAIKSLLTFLNPAKYSPKLDLAVSGTISLRGNLEAANGRVNALLKDVTPALTNQLIEKKR